MDITSPKRIFVDGGSGYSFMKSFIGCTNNDALYGGVPNMVLYELLMQGKPVEFGQELESEVTYRNMKRNLIEGVENKEDVCDTHTSETSESFLKRQRNGY